MRNHEVTQGQNLLREDGSLKEPGWSRTLIQDYHRHQVKAPKWRIKEWDYYLIQNADYAICLTISDNGYMGLESVSLINFNTQWQHTESVVVPFPMGKLKMPSTSEKGHTFFKNKRFSLSFKNDGDQRKLSCQVKNFTKDDNFSCEFTLTETQKDSLVIGTPWLENKQAFYYNQKINCLQAKGQVTLGEQVIDFSPMDSFATLDWGRGVWTYDNTWYWGNGNGMVNGQAFGFNLGYGFGDTREASENIVFYQGISHKLEDITFHHQKDYLKTWDITSSDGRFEGTFQPLLDRADLTDLKVVVSDQHQVFGHFTGYVILDDGVKLEIEQLLCFFERVHNKF